MIRRPPRSTRTGTLFPYATLFRSDVAQHHHLVIAFDLLEGALQDLHGIAVIAGEEFPIGPHHAIRRSHQAFAAGIVAGPADQGAYRFLGLGLAGAARSEEHTAELQSLMRISYDVFGLKKQKN